MKLNLKDRLIILHLVLPTFDARNNLILKKSIENKISLDGKESESVVYVSVGNGAADISFKTVSAILDHKEYEFMPEELNYMRERVNYIDQNGMFSMETMDTYDKIIEGE